MMAKECPEGELVAPKAVSWERGREGERGSREREGGREGGRERGEEKKDSCTCAFLFL